MGKLHHEHCDVLDIDPAIGRPTKPCNCRIPRSPYVARDDRNAALPAGESCGSCVHFERCHDLHGAHPDDEICDWIPIRFLKRLRMVEDRSVAQRIADGDASGECVCGHADVDHYYETGECRSYYAASDGLRHPCECNAFAAAPCSPHDQTGRSEKGE